MHLGRLAPERLEEAEPLHVVEMEVGQEDVDPLGAPELGAEQLDPRACIEDHGDTVVRADLDARRVPSVADGRLTRCRERAAAPPDARELPH